VHQDGEQREEEAKPRQQLKAVCQGGVPSWPQGVPLPQVINKQLTRCASKSMRLCEHQPPRTWASALTRPSTIVSACRRLGVATELVRRAESWCAARGAAYATMATTESNAASLALFTGRFAYAPFRRPAFLGRPVHRHRVRVPRAHRVLRLPPPLASAAYAALLPPSAAEFLPADLPALLNHKLTLGTYLAIQRGGPEEPARAPSFAMLSVWDATRSLRLRVGGAPALLRASLAAARALDRHAPWLQVPSVPDIFRPFGTYLLYGLRMSGPEGPALLRSLCQHAHNVARKNPACAVLAADLGPGDPAKAVVPHWPKFSCDEDVWCIKKLGASAASDNAGNDDDDWTTSPPPSVLFVDPREF
jgi:hypothetical protein